MTAAAPIPVTPVLYEKLGRVYDAVGFIEKRGENTAQGYSFAQALDVVRDLRAALRTQKVIVTPSVVEVRHEPIGTTRNGATILLTTATIDYTFRDEEDGYSITCRWAGTGTDQNGDKGLYKAFTGGLKYLLLVAFLLPTTDDPEHDALSHGSAPEPQDEKAAKDGERPAATRIPLDRAASIAELAVKVGAASWDEAMTSGDNAETERIFVMGAVLKAKLASLGVEKIGALNVDQAEDVEAFLAEEGAEQDAQDAAHAAAEAGAEA